MLFIQGFYVFDRRDTMLRIVRQAIFGWKIHMIIETNLVYRDFMETQCDWRSPIRKLQRLKVSFENHVEKLKTFTVYMSQGYACSVTLIHRSQLDL